VNERAAEMPPDPQSAPDKYEFCQEQCFANGQTIWSVFDIMAAQDRRLVEQERSEADI
jgi:hypothetical protein